MHPIHTKNQLLSGKSKLIENIKILLYKENENIFDYLDFEDDRIYQEPLLFAYFNSEIENNPNLDAILYGYTKPELRPEEIHVKSDGFGRIYLANIGWFHTQHKNQHLLLITDKNSELSFVLNDNAIDFSFEPLKIINNTDIELLKYSIPLLDQYYSDDGQLLVEIEDISKQNLQYLTKAWNLIKELVPTHYALITTSTKKAIIFNVDTALRNSFAALDVYGVCFSNAYQEDYNEVFFVDDIAHQTGHIIFYALVFEKESFFKVDPHTSLQEIYPSSEQGHYRDIYILFHALYTYYTTFICLDACLSASVFDGEKKYEALGRIGFYLSKCDLDLNLILSKSDYSSGPEDIFTDEGLIIFKRIKRVFNGIADKYQDQIEGFNFSNQSYNFMQSKFIELNPMKEKEC